MKKYNEQIEDAYVESNRQGDIMRDREIERSSGQDRSNRYRDDRYNSPKRYFAYDNNYHGETERLDRYGYERSAMNNADIHRHDYEQNNESHAGYPETYRSAENGYISEPVGHDLETRPYYRTLGDRRTVSTRTQGPHRGKGPKNYRRSDDRIKEDIQDRFTDDPYLDASAVEVDVKDGEVTLIGFIAERFEKRHAEDIADSVSGVRHIENRLRVQPEKTVVNANTRADGPIRSEDETD